MEALIGNSFTNAKKEHFALQDIVKPDTKAVALYFSASWCPPCRSTTTAMAPYYLKDLKRKGLEIIFVSSDKSQADFDDYLGKMPWFALPFPDRARKNKLSEKYGIEGIPTLVILDPKDGSLITDGGRAAIMSDPTGEKIPWKPRTAMEILASSKVIKGNNATAASLRDADYIALYFSASWCGPCQKFGPVLAETYNKVRSEGKKFEVVFVSCDRDAKSFSEYYAHMPWAALDFTEQAAKEELMQTFKVEGIPSLVMIDAKTGKTVNTDTVGEVAGDVKGERFPWAPQSCQVLNSSTASRIGAGPAVFIFCQSDEEAEQLHKDYCGAVDVWRGNAEEGAICHGDVCIPTGSKLDGAEDILFFVCGPTDPVVLRVKELTKAGSNPCVILELGQQQYAQSTMLNKPTPRTVRAFVQDYLQGQATKHPLTK